MSQYQHVAYNHLVLRETAESGRAITEVSNGPRAKFVRHLDFSPKNPQPVYTNEDGYDNLNPDHKPSVQLSKESRHVLGNLGKFSRLEIFAFALYEWEDLEQWPGMPISLSFAFQEYHGEEDEEPWRILLNESLRAIAESAGSFQRFEVKYLPPIPTGIYSAMAGKQWQDLLGSLTTLVIELPTYPDQGAGRLTIAHVDFLSYFPDMFFNHTSNLQHLRIAANDMAVMSHYGNREPILWSRCKMPQLKRLEITYACIDNELTGFIIEHSTTLERVLLGHCFGYSRRDWQDMFSRLCIKKVDQLVEFRIIALTVYDEGTGVNIEWDSTTDELDETREGSNNRSHKRGYIAVATGPCFAVGETCESYGGLQGSWDEDEEGQWMEEDEESVTGDEDRNESDNEWLAGNELLAHEMENTLDWPAYKEWCKLQNLIEKNRLAAGLGQGLPALIEKHWEYQTTP
jgi:hypothetical protein